LGLEVDREYRKLNEWYGKCDNFLPWLDSSEKFLNDESDPETTIPLIKEKLKTIQVPISFLFFFLYNSPVQHKSTILSAVNDLLDAEFLINVPPPQVRHFEVNAKSSK